MNGDLVSPYSAPCWQSVLCGMMLALCVALAASPPGLSFPVITPNFQVTTAVSKRSRKSAPPRAQAAPTHKPREVLLAITDT